MAPNKLKIKRGTTPIGVIGIIYESRPNVTADVASLCLKPNSLLFFTNDAYHKYLHSIAAVVEDVIDSEACGMTLNKEEANVVTDEKICRINSRISCTIRKVFWQKENIL